MPGAPFRPQVPRLSDFRNSTPYNWLNIAACAAEKLILATRVSGAVIRGSVRHPLGFGGVGTVGAVSASCKPLKDSPKVASSRS
jgi:hypothetical protein